VETRSKMSRSEQEVQEFVNGFQTLDQAKAEFVKLYEGYRTTKKSLTDAEEINKSLEEGKQKKNQEIAQLKDANKAVIEAMDTIKANSKAEIVKAVSDFKEMEMRWRGAEDKCRDREDEIDKMRASCVELKSKLAELENSERELKILHKSVDNLNAQLITLTSKSSSSSTSGPSSSGVRTSTGADTKELRPNPNLELFHGRSKADVDNWLYMIEDHVSHS